MGTPIRIRATIGCTAVLIVAREFILSGGTRSIRTAIPFGANIIVVARKGVVLENTSFFRITPRIVGAVFTVRTIDRRPHALKAQALVTHCADIAIQALFTVQERCRAFKGQVITRIDCAQIPVITGSLVNITVAVVI